MSVEAKYNLLLKVYESISLDYADNPEWRHLITGLDGTLNASSTVPATMVWSDERTLAGASETLDFTALARSPLANVDATGLKLQLMLLKAAEGNNVAGLLFDVGATNGYNLLGNANGQVLLHPGAAILQFEPDKLPDVSGTEKTIDISGTAADEYGILLVFG